MVVKQNSLMNRLYLSHLYLFYIIINDRPSPEIKHDFSGHVRTSCISGCCTVNWNWNMSILFISCGGPKWMYIKLFFWLNYIRVIQRREGFADLVGFGGQIILLHVSDLNTQIMVWNCWSIPHKLDQFLKKY